jgi:hypothetical protein
VKWNAPYIEDAADAGMMMQWVVGSAFSGDQNFVQICHKQGCVSGLTVLLTVSLYSALYSPLLILVLVTLFIHCRPHIDNDSTTLGYARRLHFHTLSYRESWLFSFFVSS